MRSTFRGQLILGLIPVAALLGTTTLTAVLGVWPVVVLQAVFLVASIARVIMIFRVRRLGGYASDVSERPPSALLNREYLLVLRTQLVCWILAGIYFAIFHFWWYVVLAVFLGYITLPVMQLINRKAREHAQPAG